MTTAIPEDLLLLLLDDEKGTTPSGVAVGTVLGGALLVELSLAELVRVEKDGGRWARAKVFVVEGAASPDPLLAGALAVVAEKPRPAEDLVDRLGKDAKDRVADRLTERGVLARRDTKVLGLFPSKRWPAADGSRERDLRAHLQQVLVAGLEPDDRTAALVALLSAVGQAHRVVDHDGVPARQVKKRAQEIADGDWCAQAVRDAIRAAMAATTAVMAATTVATTATVT